MAIIDLKLCHSTDFHGYFDPQISFKCLTIIWGGVGQMITRGMGKSERGQNMILCYLNGPLMVMTF